MFKKITSLLCISMISFTLVFGYSSEDVRNANYLGTRGVIMNWSEKPENYNFGDTVSRLEVINLALEIAGIERNQYCRGDFADVSKKTINLACRTIETAADHGFINNMQTAIPSQRKVRPFVAASRAEALSILMKTAHTDSPAAEFDYYWAKNFPEIGGTRGYKDSYAWGATWQAEVFYDYIRRILQDDAKLSLISRPMQSVIHADLIKFAKNIVIYLENNDMFEGGNQ